MNKRAFSLIEVIIGLGLFSILASTTTVIMFSSIRTSRKAAAVALAKTEGAYALKAMESQIHYAGSVDSATCGLSLKMYKLTTGELITYSLNTVNHRLASGSSYLTSNDVTVSQGSPVVCPNVFVCTSNSVNICFVIDTANGMDVTDRAGLNGIMFQSMVTLANTAQ